MATFLRFIFIQINSTLSPEGEGEASGLRFQPVGLTGRLPARRGLQPGGRVGAYGSER